MKKHTRVIPIFLIAFLVVFAFPMTAAAAKPAPPSPPPAAISITGAPSGTLQVPVGPTGAQITLTSTYSKALNWSATATFGTAALSSVKTTPIAGVQTTTLTVKSTTAGTGTVSVTATDSLNRKIKTTLSFKVEYVQDELVYVALGDSIPDGFYYTSLWNYLAGGTDSYSYIEQFRDALGILPANYYDESVSGYNTIDVVNQLANTTIRTAITQADVITLCIGANEIMDAAPRTASGLDKYGVSWAQADLGRDTFEANWITIIDGIENLNGDATLIVMTVYNPYRTTETIYPTANAYFESTAAGDYGLNYIIRNTETLYDPLLGDAFDYRVADVYSAFNASANKDSLTGFYSSFCDPHPNQTGQNLLFTTHIGVYQ